MKGSRGVGEHRELEVVSHGFLAPTRGVAHRIIVEASLISL